MPTCGNVWLAFGSGLLLGAALLACLLVLWGSLRAAGAADERMEREMANRRRGGK